MDSNETLFHIQAGFDTTEFDMPNSQGNLLQAYYFWQRVINSCSCS